MKTWHVVGTALLVAAAGVAAQDPPPERKALKVCQDPNNLPFTNEKLEGFEKVDYVLYRTCRLIYANPRLEYRDTTLNDLFPTHAERRICERSLRNGGRLRTRRTIAKVAEMLGKTRSDFLEIGCGHGDALEAAAEIGFRVVGTSTNLVIPKRGEGVATVTLTGLTPGKYTFECNRMCGAGHHFMRGVLTVIPASGAEP